MLKKQVFLLFLFFSFLLFFYSCSSYTKKYNKETILDKTTFSFDQSVYPNELELFSEYKILPGDVLDVLFQIHRWRLTKEFRIGAGYTVEVHFPSVPNLDQRQTVLPDGTIVLPYIGKVKVFGKTIEELTKELNQKYSKIFKRPNIYVVVPKFDTAIEQLREDLHTAPRGLSRLTRVRPDGYATFPLIGDIFVAHRTVPELNKILNEKYDDILPGLHVDLFIEKHVGALVYVLGEVNKPGAYNITRPTNILEILSLAGGYTHQAQLKNIIVFRKHERKIVSKIINVAETLKSQNALFYVRPDDLIYIPKNQISSLSQIMQEISKIALFNGWGMGFSYNLNK